MSGSLLVVSRPVVEMPEPDPDPAPDAEPEPDPEPDPEPEADPPSVPTLRPSDPSSEPHAATARRSGTTASRAASLGTRIGPPGHGSTKFARKANRTSRRVWKVELGDGTRRRVAQPQVAPVGPRDRRHDRQTE